MLSPSATSSAIVLILAIVSGQALASAVKGYSIQQQQQQQPIKSPVAQQQLERQPKSALPAQAAPVLESSKKVYNDESIRRSASQQQQVVSEPVGKSSAPVVVSASAPEPVKPAVVPAAAPVVAAPVAKPAEPVVPVAAAPAPVENKVEAQVEPKSEMKPSVEKPIEEKPQPVAVAAAAEELPVQSVRSAPVKEEPQPASKVLVEQVVPAKVPQQSAPVPVPAVEKPVESVPVVPVVQPPVPVAAAPVQEQPAAAVKPAAEVAAESPLQAKKDEQAPSAAAGTKEEPAPIEVPAPDPGLILSEPIDSTTKLLIDLDEHVQKFLPAEDKQEPAAPSKEQVLVSGVDYSPAAAASSPEAQPSGKSDAPLKPYSSVNEPEPIVPPLPQSIEKVEKASNSVAAASAPVVPAGSGSQQAANTRQASHQHQNQQQVITQLLDQLDSLQNRIQDTINQLVARRRYVMSALLRPMGTYVRRVRTNLERLQNRVNQLQAAAVSVGGNQNGQRPGGFVDAAAIETIRRRIDDISKRISDIVNRIRFSLTPTSAPLNSNGK